MSKPISIVESSTGLQRIINALVVQAGGEIRISPSLLADLDRNPIKIQAFIDPGTGETVFQIDERQPYCKDCGANIEAGFVCEVCSSIPERSEYEPESA